MEQFKIRASAAGKIMQNDRSGKAMGQGAKSYLQTWLKEQLYARKQTITSKYMDKGLIMEDNAIDFISDYYKYGMLVKNEQSYSNEYCTGTPDIILNDMIIDVKCSWDCFTFPLFDDELPNKDYYYQMQTYMMLCNKSHASVIYALMDTPIDLIEKEAFWHAKNNGYDELDSEIYDKFLNDMTYSSIPDSLKIKKFDIERNETVIEAIQSRVLQCRDYLQTLIV